MGFGGYGTNSDVWDVQSWTREPRASVSDTRTIPCHPCLALLVRLSAVYISIDPSFCGQGACKGEDVVADTPDTDATS